MNLRPITPPPVKPLFPKEIKNATKTPALDKQNLPAPKVDEGDITQVAPQKQMNVEPLFKAPIKTSNPYRTK